jgi:formate hydrogenlyase subunit 6/NADH:ubiquinone oxidoreductase subunit I
MIKPGRMFNTLLASLFRKPATENYPAVKAQMPLHFRGQIRFIPQNCIGCKMCMRDCPSDAIEIRKVGDKQFEAVFELGRCLYCAQCVDTCPKSALEITDRFELAALDPKSLRVVFESVARPQDAPPPPGAASSAAPSSPAAGAPPASDAAQAPGSPAPSHATPAADPSKPAVPNPGSVPPKSN